MCHSHVDYSDLKTSEAQKTQEELFPFPFAASKNLSRGPMAGKERSWEITF